LPESNSFGTSQLEYKLKVEAVSLYFKSSNIGKLFPTSGMVIFHQDRVKRPEPTVITRLSMATKKMTG
jgi:hypothetical protein